MSIAKKIEKTLKTSRHAIIIAAFPAERGGGYIISIKNGAKIKGVTPRVAYLYYVDPNRDIDSGLNIGTMGFKTDQKWERMKNSFTKDRENARSWCRVKSDRESGAFICSIYGERGTEYFRFTIGFDKWQRNNLPEISNPPYAAKYTENGNKKILMLRFNETRKPKIAASMQGLWIANQVDISKIAVPDVNFLDLPGNKNQDITFMAVPVTQDISLVIRAEKQLSSIVYHCSGAPLRSRAQYTSKAVPFGAFWTRKGVVVVDSGDGVRLMPKYVSYKTRKAVDIRKVLTDKIIQGYLAQRDPRGGLSLDMTIPIPKVVRDKGEKEIFEFFLSQLFYKNVDATTPVQIHYDTDKKEMLVRYGEYDDSSVQANSATNEVEDAKSEDREQEDRSDQSRSGSWLHRPEIDSLRPNQPSQDSYMHLPEANASGSESAEESDAELTEAVGGYDQLEAMFATQGIKIPPKPRTPEEKARAKKEEEAKARAKAKAIEEKVLTDAKAQKEQRSREWDRIERQNQRDQARQEQRDEVEKARAVMAIVIDRVLDILEQSPEEIARMFIAYLSEIEKPKFSDGLRFWFSRVYLNPLTKWKEAYDNFVVWKSDEDVIDKNFAEIINFVAVSQASARSEERMNAVAIEVEKIADTQDEESKQEIRKYVKAFPESSDWKFELEVATNAELAMKEWNKESEQSDFSPLTAAREARALRIARVKADALSSEDESGAGDDISASESAAPMRVTDSPSSGSSSGSGVPMIDVDAVRDVGDDQRDHGSSSITQIDIDASRPDDDDDDDDTNPVPLKGSTPRRTRTEDLMKIAKAYSDTHYLGQRGKVTKLERRLQQLGNTVEANAVRDYGYGDVVLSYPALQVMGNSTCLENTVLNVQGRLVDELLGDRHREDAVAVLRNATSTLDYSAESEMVESINKLMSGAITMVAWVDTLNVDPGDASVSHFVMFALRRSASNSTALELSEYDSLSVRGGNPSPKTRLIANNIADYVDEVGDVSPLQGRYGTRNLQTDGSTCGIFAILTLAEVARSGIVPSIDRPATMDEMKTGRDAIFYALARLVRLDTYDQLAPVSPGASMGLIMFGDGGDVPIDQVDDEKVFFLAEAEPDAEPEQMAINADEGTIQIYRTGGLEGLRIRNNYMFRVILRKLAEGFNIIVPLTADGYLKYGHDQERDWTWFADQRALIGALGMLTLARRDIVAISGSFKWRIGADSGKSIEVNTRLDRADYMRAYWQIYSMTGWDFYRRHEDPASIKRMLDQHAAMMSRPGDVYGYVYRYGDAYWHQVTITKENVQRLVSQNIDSCSFISGDMGDRWYDMLRSYAIVIGTENRKRAETLSKQCIRVLQPDRYIASSGFTLWCNYKRDPVFKRLVGPERTYTEKVEGAVPITFARPVTADTLSTGELNLDVAAVALKRVMSSADMTIHPVVTTLLANNHFSLVVFKRDVADSGVFLVEVFDPLRTSAMREDVAALATFVLPHGTEFSVLPAYDEKIQIEQPSIRCGDLAFLAIMYIFKTGTFPRTVEVLTAGDYANVMHTSREWMANTIAKVSLMHVSESDKWTMERLRNAAKSYDPDFSRTTEKTSNEAARSITITLSDDDDDDDKYSDDYDRAVEKELAAITKNAGQKKTPSRFDDITSFSDDDYEDFTELRVEREPLIQSYKEVPYIPVHISLNDSDDSDDDDLEEQLAAMERAYEGTTESSFINIFERPGVGKLGNSISAPLYERYFEFLGTPMLEERKAYLAMFQALFPDIYTERARRWSAAHPELAPNGESARLTQIRSLPKKRKLPPAPNNYGTGIDFDDLSSSSSPDDSRVVVAPVPSSTRPSMLSPLPVRHKNKNRKTINFVFSDSDDDDDDGRTEIPLGGVLTFPWEARPWDEDTSSTDVAFEQWATVRSGQVPGIAYTVGGRWTIRRPHSILAKLVGGNRIFIPRQYSGTGPARITIEHLMVLAPDHDYGSSDAVRADAEELVGRKVMSRLLISMGAKNRPDPDKERTMRTILRRISIPVNFSATASKMYPLLFAAAYTNLVRMQDRYHLHLIMPTLSETSRRGTVPFVEVAQEALAAFMVMTHLYVRNRVTDPIPAQCFVQYAIERPSDENAVHSGGKVRPTRCYRSRFMSWTPALYVIAHLMTQHHNGDVPRYLELTLSKIIGKHAFDESGSKHKLMSLKDRGYSKRSRLNGRGGVRGRYRPDMSYLREINIYRDQITQLAASDTVAEVVRRGLHTMPSGSSEADELVLQKDLRPLRTYFEHYHAWVGLAESAHAEAAVESYLREERGRKVDADIDRLMANN